jgi:hypothetical protein
MKLIFAKGRSYRAFVAPEFGLTIVSDRIEEVAVGTTIDSILTVVRDSKSYLLDVELKLDMSHNTEQIPRCVQAVMQQDEDFACEIAEGASVTWTIDDSAGYFGIRIGSEQVARWIQIGQNPFWVGLTDQAHISVLACSDVVFDRSGAAEEEWLNEVRNCTK